MSVKTLTHTFSTVTGSGGTASINLTIDADNIAILFVKVEPSIMGGTADFDIFQKDTLLSADISYRATAFAGDLVDPIEDISGVETERTEGFLTAYQDDDASKELHIKVTNNDTSTKDFDITIRYLVSGDVIESEPFFLTSINTETLSADKTIAASGQTIHFLDPGGASRNVDLMPEVAGQVVIIVNTADAAENLTVREDAGVTTIVTIAQNEMALLVCNGTVWKGMVGANT